MAIVKGGRLSPNRLSKTDRRELIRLLSVLRVHLASAIESNLVPDTRDVMPEDRANVELDRI